MKSGTCPKCNSLDIYSSEEQADGALDGNYILVRTGLLRNDYIKLIYCACGQCQYIESYVADDESM